MASLGTVPATPLLEMIASGTLDDHLDSIADAVHARRKVKAITHGASLVVGQMVAINEHAKEGWPAGQVKGRIESKGRDGSRIQVIITDLPGGLPRMHLRGRRYVITGQTWTLPAEWLTVLR